MTVLMSALSVAEKVTFKLLHNLALIRLALLMLFLDQPRQSLRIISEILPYVLTHAPIADQGMAQYVMAMTAIAQDSPNYEDSKNCLEDAIKSSFYF